MNTDWYTIKDLDYFINYSRAVVFNSFGKKDETKTEKELVKYALDHLSLEDKEELDTILSYDESLTIIKSIIKVQKHKKTNKTRYVINDSIYMEILESLGDRMTSNLLNNLVNRGLVETAYDSDVDDFVFWVKNNEKENKKSEAD